MSQENVEVVRRAYALLSQGDQRALDLVAPDFVADFSRRLVDALVLHGRDEVLAFLFKGPLRETWDGWPIWEPIELTDAGDKVFTLIRFSARGKASGVEAAAEVAMVWTFRDGEAVQIKYFGADRSAALDAAGLSE